MIIKLFFNYASLACASRSFKKLEYLIMTFVVFQRRNVDSTFGALNSRLY